MILDYLILLALSSAPFTEARGGVVYGLASGLTPELAFSVAVLANIVVIPIIFWALEISHLNSLAVYLFGKKMARKIDTHSKKLEKYGELALLAFVAIPLPVTGAYTGTLIASLLRFNKWESFLVISAGVIISAFIATLGFYGVLSLV